MSVYVNPIIGRWLDEAGHPGARSWAIGPAPILDGEGNPVLDEAGEPTYEEDAPDRYEVRGWEEAWGELPTEDELAEWEPPPISTFASPIPAIAKGYADSEVARKAAVELLKSTASYALGAKLAGDLARANPPKTAEELEALKAAAKSEASRLGGLFFDAYFQWIGAYREGGGPGFLAALMADQSTEFLAWPTPAQGIVLPDGQVVLPNGGQVRDLFPVFLR